MEFITINPSHQNILSTVLNRVGYIIGNQITQMPEKQRYELQAHHEISPFLKFSKIFLIRYSPFILSFSCS